MPRAPQERPAAPETIDLAVGRAIDLAVGRAADLAVGRAINLGVGRAIDLGVGEEIDPKTGEEPLLAKHPAAHKRREEGELLPKRLLRARGGLLPKHHPSPVKPGVTPYVTE
mmetsp:Transcript_27560/g.60849  ORF Transcript_27560/g.60849 Transcript_27560/m.60849 type:complete len:112 (-) Transcript_27560:377-712(-)